MTLHLMTEDVTETKAHALVNACNGLGLAASFFWDRGPYCAQVYLTEEHNEYAPAIFFMLEDADTYKIHVGDNPAAGWKWQGQIGGFADDWEQDALMDVTFEIIERTWLGDSEHTVAKKIGVLLSILDVSELAKA